MGSQVTAEQLRRIAQGKTTKSNVRMATPEEIAAEKNSLGPNVRMATPEEIAALQPAKPELPWYAPITEGLKGLARGSIDVTQSVVGDIPETAGAAMSQWSSANGNRMDPMGESPFQPFTPAQAAQIPQGKVYNPLEGQSAAVEKTLRPYAQAPSIQADPRLNSTDSEYMNSPLFNQATRLASEVGQGAPSLATAAVGGMIAGPVGAGLAGGSLVGSDWYLEAKKKGMSDKDAIVGAAVMSGGSAVLNSLPFLDKLEDFVPPNLRGRVANFFVKGTMEGMTESAEPGVSPFADIAAGRRKVETWEDAQKVMEDVGTQVKGGMSQFPASFVLGGGMGAMHGAKQEAGAPPVVPPTAPPVDRLQPGPNAPTPVQQEAEQLLSELSTPTRPEEIGTPRPVSRYPVRVQDRPYPGQRPSVNVPAPDVRATVRNMSTKPEAAPVSEPAIPQPTPEQLALEQQILGADLVDSRDIPKPDAPATPKTAKEKLASLRDARKQSLIDTTVAQEADAPETQISKIDNIVNSIAPAGDTTTRNGQNDIRRVVYDALGIVPPAVPDTVTGMVPPDDMEVRIGESVLSNRTGKNLESPEVMDAITQSVMRKDMEARGIDPERALGPESGLNDAQKGLFYTKAKAEAKSIVDSIYSALPEAPTLPASPSQSDVEPQTQPEATQTAPETPKAVEAPVENARRAGTAPHEMTRDEFASFNVRRMMADNPGVSDKILEMVYSKALNSHKSYVDGAIQGGAEIDPRVLADYPDLAPSELTNNTGEQPAAEWLGWQDMGPNKPAVPFYNIPSPNGGMTSVSAETAKAQGYSVPEPPVEAPTTPAQAKEALKQRMEARNAPEPALSPETQAIVDAYGGREQALAVLNRQRDSLRGNEKVSPQTLAAIEELTGGKKTGQADLFGQGDMQPAPKADLPGQTRLPQRTELKINAEMTGESIRAGGKDGLHSFRDLINRLKVRPEGEFTKEDLGLDKDKKSFWVASTGKIGSDQALEMAKSQDYGHLLPDDAGYADLIELMKDELDPKIQVEPEGMYAPSIDVKGKTFRPTGTTQSIGDIMKGIGFTEEVPVKPERKPRPVKEVVPVESKADITAGERMKEVADQLKAGAITVKQATSMRKQILRDQATENKYEKKNAREAKAKAKKAKVKAEVIDDTPVKGNTFYFKGDKARYTGETSEQYGSTWHEFEYLEGSNKGKKGVRLAPDDPSASRDENNKPTGRPTPQVPPASKESKINTSGYDTAITNLDAARPIEDVPVDKDLAREHALINKVFERIINLKGVEQVSEFVYRVPSKLMTPARRQSLRTKAQRDGGYWSGSIKTGDYELLPMAEMTNQKNNNDYAIRVLKGRRDSASPVSAAANRAAMPAQREGTNYEKTLGAIGDTLAENKGVVADATQPWESPSAKAEMDLALSEDAQDRANDIAKTKQQIKDVKSGKASYSAVPQAGSKSSKAGAVRSLEQDIERLSSEPTEYDVKRIIEQKIERLMLSDKNVPSALLDNLKTPKYETGTPLRQQFVEMLEARGYSLDGDNYAKSAPKAKSVTTPSQATATVPRKITVNKLLSIVPKDIIAYDSKTNTISFDASDAGITKVREAMDSALDSLPQTPTSQAKYEEAYGEIMDAVFSKQEEATPSSKPKKRGSDPRNPEAGVLNIGAAVGGIRGAVRTLMGDKPFLEFHKDLRDAKDLNVRRTGDAAAIVREAEQALADLTKAWRDSVGGLTVKVKQMPDVLRQQINEYMSEQDPAKKSQLLAAFPPNLQQPTQHLREMVDATSRMLLSEGVATGATAEIIQENEGTYLRRTYRIFKDKDFKDKIPDAVKERVRKWLENEHSDIASQPNGAQEIQKMLNSLINIADSTEPVVIRRGKKLGTKDLSTLMKRNDFPQEILDLWGVEKDGVVNFLETMTSMAHMIANHKFYREVAKAGEGQYVFSKEYMDGYQKGDNPAYEKMLANNELVPWDENSTKKQNVRPATETGPYGAMQGSMVHRDFKKAMQDAVKIDEVAPWVANLNTINSWMKMGKTVFSPTTQSLNMLSNTYIALANGHLLYGNPIHIANRMRQAIGMASTELTSRHNPKWREQGNRAVQLRVMGDTDTASELMALRGESKRNTINKGAREIAAKIDPVFEKAIDGLGYMRDIAIKLYQGGDDVWKAFAWLTETQHLQDAGMPKVKAEEEAALRVRRMYPTYTETSNLVQKARRFPVAGPFVSFVSEMPRNSINTLMQTQLDLRSNNPKVRAMGIRRASGIIASIGSAYAAEMIGRMTLDMDDDDEKALRNGLAPWDRNSLIDWNSFDRKKGVATGQSISRMNPYGILFDPVNAFLRADGPGSGLAEASMQVADPFISEEIGFKTIRQQLQNLDEYNNPIVLESDPMLERFWKRAAAAWKVGEVGGVASARRIMADDNPAKRALQEATGQRIVKVDMNKSLRMKAFEFQRQSSEPLKDVRAAVKSGDKAAVREQYDQYLAAHRKGFDALHDMVAGMKHIGVSNRDIAKALDEAGVSEENRIRIIKGKYKKPAMRPDVMKALR